MEKIIPKDNVFRECGCCGQFHPIDFVGDCREDRQRFTFGDLESLIENYEIYSLEQQIKDEENGLL